MAKSNKKIVFKFSYNAPVILTFALISLIVLLVNGLTNGASNRLLFSTYRSRLTDPLTYVRAFGHVLGHANWAHYFGNMTMFLLVGPMLEEKYGSKNMVGMIAITAVVTALINAIFFPGVALCGASGIVFMFILLSSFAAANKGEIPITLLVILAMYLGDEVVNAVFQRDNISQMAHIVGGLAGCAFGFAFLNGWKKK